MVLTREAAYEILNLPIHCEEERVIFAYKALALDWFPKKHHFSPISIDKFKSLSEALLTLIDIPNTKLPVPEKPMTLEEMLSLFQLIFFGNDENEDEEISSDSFSEDSFDDEDLRVYNNLMDHGYLIKNNIDESDISGKDDNDAEAKEVEAVKNAENLLLEEERLKKKAKNKKAQKKRRKERKKQEKNETEKNSSNNSDGAQNVSKDDSESDQSIDTSSAFVAEIAKKKIGVSIPNKNRGDADKEDQSRVLRSHEIAIEGNNMANMGRYKEAIKFFTDALRLEPSDHRFYSNRSYCYDRIGNYDKALDDAKRSISIAPKVPKGHFRKGKALCSLERYEEAEKCFVEVLALDENCDDAEKELMRVKILRLARMGFTKEQATIAIQQCDNVQDAFNFLSCSSPNRNELEDHTIFTEQDDNEFISVSKQYTPPITDIKMDPSNPEGHNSLWVGNIQHEMTIQELTNLFSRYGELLSVKLMTESFCAFINYKQKASAGMAMCALQGMKVHGVNLLIRFPNMKPTSAPTPNANTAKETLKKSAKQEMKYYAPVNGDECYFWRNGGCIHGMNCKYKHIPHHKSIDRDKKTLR